MLRWAIPFLLTMVAVRPAAAADEALARQGKHQGLRRTAVNLPAGLPRPHYKFRTTIAPGAPYAPRRYYARPLPAEEEPELLFTPTGGSVRYVGPLFGWPLLPGSSTLPGYYGWSYSYDYQGPYYGGPNYSGYWDRLPYACGVYGYC
jgi:hypothetical protein